MEGEPVVALEAKADLSLLPQTSYSPLLKEIMAAS
jgi:hypothetical protein